VGNEKLGSNGFSPVVLNLAHTWNHQEDFQNSYIPDNHLRLSKGRIAYFLNSPNNSDVQTSLRITDLAQLLLPLI
jgi:hypothetical protein